VISGQDFDSLWPTNSTGGIHSWSVRDLTIDGNKANQTDATARGIEVYGYNWTIDHVRIRDCAGDGIHSLWSDDAGAPLPNSMEARLTDVEVNDCGGHGIHWGGPHDSMWWGIVAWHNVLGNFYVRPKGGALIATACHAWGPHAWSWYLEGTGTKLHACTGEGAADGQCFVGANDAEIVGGAWFGAGSTKGIQLGDGSHGPIAGCRIECSTQNFTTWAINFANSGGGNVVRLNNYQTTGNPIAGTPNARDDLEVFPNVGAVGNARAYRWTTTHFANGLSTVSKAGVPTDADVYDPRDNFIMVDSTNSRLYVRVAGAWKYAALT
jgi:hypothetical protein